jgi:hypothetical protein
MNYKTVEGSGRGVVWATVPTFVWRDWTKLWKTSISIVDLEPETENQYFPKSKQEYYPLDNDVQILLRLDFCISLRTDELYLSHI